MISYFILAMAKIMETGKTNIWKFSGNFFHGVPIFLLSCILQLKWDVSQWLEPFK